jgi:mono/diheme cytochrome c family protein
MKTLKFIGRWTGYLLLAIIVMALSLWGYSSWQIDKRLNKVYPTNVPSITIPEDEQAIAMGAHLFVVHGCRDCHGADLKGKAVLDNPLLGTVRAPNLTKGKGALPADFDNDDWLRVLKHGVDRDGKPLIIMPAHETTLISDKDLAEIIAYCKSVAPQDEPLTRAQKLGPLLQVLTVFGDADEVLPAEKIDHAARHVAAQTPAATAEYGKYLATNCAACHNQNFQGGPPLAPGYPPVPNITSRGRVGKWSQNEFIRTLRTGITPEGHRLDSTKMPWKRTAEFSDTELIAVRKFLMGLPEKGKLGDTLLTISSNHK